VRSRLGQVFKADEATLDKLFSGKPQLLKRDCDKATALKYKQAMEQAGAQPLIKAVQPEAEAAPPAPQTAAEKIAALAAAADTGAHRAAADPEPRRAAAAPVPAGEPEVAPAGSEVLREDERPTPVVREVDTSGLAVDTAAQRLSAESPAPPPAPDTSHLDMAAVGELIPNLPSDLAPLSPDTDSLSLSPEGTDFSDCAAPEPAPPDLDLSALDVAPAGADVLEEQYRKKEQPAPPPTDHLTLKD